MIQLFMFMLSCMNDDGLFSQSLHSTKDLWIEHKKIYVIQELNCGKTKVLIRAETLMATGAGVLGIYCILLRHSSRGGQVT